MTVTETETRPEASAESSAAVVAPAPGGLAGVLGTGEHKTIGRLYIGTSIVFLLLAGVTGALVGAERIDTARLDVLGRDSFAQVFTLHSVSAVFLFLIPFLLGLAIVLVPLQVGAATIAFPRAAAASYWSYLITGGVLVGAYAINGGPFGGSVNGVTLFLAAFAGLLISLLLATVCVVTTVLALRTTGMSLDRVPLFSWSMLVAGSVWLLSLPVLLAGTVLLYVNATYGVGFFGDTNFPVNGQIYRVMLWAFQQPQLYAFAVPALGIIGDIVPTFSGARLGVRQRQAAMAAIGLAGALGFGAWAQRWIAPELSNEALYGIVAFAVLLPFLVIAGVSADTLRRGSVRLRSPLVFCVAGLLMLLAGAAAGAASAINQLDLLTPDTTWTSAQAHYVLLGVAIVAIGGCHFWAPKLFGRELREGAGLITALMLLVGTVALALPDAVSGALDQLRALDQAAGATVVRNGVEALNTISFAGGIVVTIGVVAFVFNVVMALVRGRDADVAADPWGGQTLEWTTASPPPAGNFPEAPVVQSPEPALDPAEAAAS
jgi:heme/copper-type cytochrome/quinol oxidase subunit 1